MAVKIRMTRIGRRHRPFFRINAVDGRTPRDGRILEKLGHYDPIEKDPAKQVVLNLERVNHWLELGAVPSETVSQILLKLGVKTKHAEAKALLLVAEALRDNAALLTYTYITKIAPGVQVMLLPSDNQFLFPLPTLEPGSNLLPILPTPLPTPVPTPVPTPEASP